MYPKLDGTTRFDMVEVTIPNNFTGGYQKFDDQPQLRSDQEYDIVIQAIETYTIFDLALSQTGKTMPNVAQLISTSLILYVDGEESIFQMALSQLHRIITRDGAGLVVPYTRDLQVFDNIQVSWEKCKLFNPANNGWNTGASGQFSYQFGVHYKRLPVGTMAKINGIRDANYCNIGSKNG
jgi:hypothetical protein